MFDHFQPAEHVALGIGQGLALLGGEDGGQFLDVFPDQLLVLEEDPRAGADRRLAPGLEGFLGAGHRGIDLVLGGEGHARQHFLSGGVDDIAPLIRLRLDEFAIDQQFDGGNIVVAHYGPLGGALVVLEDVMDSSSAFFP